MRTTFIRLVIFIITGSPLLAQKIPTGTAPMIDGRHESNEWKDARDITLPNGFHLYVKKNESFVFVSMLSSGDTIGYVSLYIDTESTPITDLHSSARLGERTLIDGRFREWTAIFPDDTWFNHDQWTSNYAWFKCRPGTCADLRFPPAKEFQISRSKFGSSQWKVYLTYSYIHNGKWEDGKFPVSSTETNTDGWIIFSL